MSGRLRAIALVLFFLMLLPAAGCEDYTAVRPNFIFLLTDTLRADYLGAYGFQGGISPAFDKLAGESLRFSHAFTNAPWTKPSIATLFTSLFPQVHGLTNHSGNYWGFSSKERREGILPDAAVTLAEQLRARGYRTAAFVANPLISSRYGFQQGFEVYHDRESNVGTRLNALVDDALAWLASLKPDEPYFLYLHAMDVHGPYIGSKQDYDALEPSPSLGADRMLAVSEMPELKTNPLEFKPPWADEATRRHLHYWRTRYASGVRAFDRQLDALLSALRQNGQLDRSVFIFTADHGEELQEHGGWNHGKSLFEHQMHIPLLVRRPGGRGGRVIDNMVEHVDLMPTLLALAGASPSAGMQGRDLSRLIRGGRLGDSGVVFGTATMGAPGLYSVRTPTHKLLFDAYSGRMQLFDLEHDPAERKDVAGEHPALVNELRDRLTAHIRDSVANGTLESKTITIPPEDRERLRALGYVD